MSDYNHYKKADLVNVLKKLEIHCYAKDTKKVLVDKLDAYVQQHPLDGELTVQGLLEQDADDQKTLTEPHVDDEEEDEEEEENDEENDDVNDDDADKDDDDFEGPPLDLKQWLVDPVIDFTECAYSKVLELTDSVGITTTDFSEDLRDRLSKTVTLAYLELFVEFVCFVYTFLPVVELSDNALNHHLLEDSLPWLGTSSWWTPDFTALISCKVVSTFLIWVVSSIILPGGISYFINFSKRVLVFDGEEGLIARIYTFDPFVFSLSKVLIFYFISGRSSLTTLSTLGGICNAVHNYFAIQLGLYSSFASVLGSLPIVLGLTNVAIALYAQFEDY
jgi:hypothetical protein